MPGDTVQVPITLMGSYERPVGYALIEVATLRQIEPIPEAWGIGFCVNQRTGTIMSIDFFPHEVMEDRSIEAEAKEVGDENVLEISSGE